MEIAQHIKALQPSYIREILSAATNPGVISLAGGLPSDQSFPLGLMADAIADLPTQRGLFQYGETAGFQPLLAYCRKNVSLSENHQSIICTGSQQALDLVARTFLNKGDSVLVESPSYLGALQVFAISQATIETVTQGSEGPDLAQVEALFASKKIKMFYAVPDFHNPTGVCWSLHTRQQVAALCVKYDVTLIEDCPYRELRFSGDAHPLVSTFCPEQALLLKSFSKIVAPGIRIGVISGKSQWIEPMIKVKQAADLHSSLPLQSVLLSVLQHPEFVQHVDEISKLYQRQYQALCDALHTNLGQHCEFEPVQGGMFIWLKLLCSDSMKVARRAIRSQVAVVPGEVFYIKNICAQSYLRLNFSHCPRDQYNQAIARLATCVR